MTTFNTTTAALGEGTQTPCVRAFALLKSRRRLDIPSIPIRRLGPTMNSPGAVPRTMRWGGVSQWAHPLSVAQHSLTVLAVREAEGPLNAGERLRELLHDATEFILGWDCIAPLKAQLPEPFRQKRSGAADFADRTLGDRGRPLQEPYLFGRISAKSGYRTLRPVWTPDRRHRPPRI